MKYLRENIPLIFLALIIPLLFYFDKTAILWVKSNTAFYSEAAYRPAIAVVKFVTHGTTLIVSSLFLFLFAGPYRMNLRNMGRTLLAGLIISGAVVQIFKHLIGRARPRVTVDPVFVGPSLHGDYDAFPSGHSTLAFCFAFVLSHYYPRYGFIFYVFALLTGTDRLIGFSHFPSDILAGALLGTIIAKAVIKKMSDSPVPLSPEKTWEKTLTLRGNKR